MMDMAIAIVAPSNDANVQSQENGKISNRKS